MNEEVLETIGSNEAPVDVENSEVNEIEGNSPAESEVPTEKNLISTNVLDPNSNEIGNNIEKSVSNECKLEVIVESDEFLKAKNKVYNTFKNRFDVPGFRKGKAPMNIIEKRHGNVFSSLALEQSFQEKFNELKETLSFKVYSVVSTNLEEFSEENGARFTVTVSKYPAVDFSVEYKNLEIKRPKNLVTDEDVNEELRRMQKSNAKIHVVERAAADGDHLDIDYEVYLDGNRLDDITSKNFAVEIGSKATVEGFEGHLIGANVGDDLDFELKFPDEFYDERLKGKVGRFKVHINKITEHELVEIDDEFAKDVSAFDTLDELISDTKNKLKNRADTQQKNLEQDAVLNELAKYTELNIPDEMISEQAEMTFYNTFYELGLENSPGFSRDILKNAWNGLDENMKQRYKDVGKKNLQSILILDRIAKLEDIDVTDADVEQEILNLSKSKGKSFKKEEIDTSEISNVLKRRKALELLVDNAKFIEE